MFTPTIMLISLGGSIWNMWRSWDRGGNRLNAGLIFLLVTLIFIFYWYSRYFALRAQDRAIRVEQSFRHYILTGKPLDIRLRMGQIVALRFAEDDEFVGLTQKAIDESLSPKDIKQAIVNWKADHNRA